MAARKTTTRRRQVRRVTGPCSFCTEEDIQISYKDTELLSRYVTDRGKIVPRARSGVCAKHQRKLSREIKRARHLALLPFTVSPTV